MDPTIVLLAVLVAISAGALAYAFLFQQIEVEKKTTSRFKRVQAAETDRVNIKAARDRVQELSKRRKSMQDSLRDMEKKQNEKAKKAKNVACAINSYRLGWQFPFDNSTFSASARRLAPLLLHLSMVCRC